MDIRTFDLRVCGGALVFYIVNRCLLILNSDGHLGWFLSCYANDLFAGGAICAWADYLLRWGRLAPLRSVKHAVPLLLACGLVWEVLAPLWKAGAVFDPWDFVAYQAGGLLYLTARERACR